MATPFTTLHHAGHGAPDLSRRATNGAWSAHPSHGVRRRDVDRPRAAVLRGAEQASRSGCAGEAGTRADCRASSISSPTSTATWRSCSAGSDHRLHVPRQLRRARDHLQDRLLRAWAVGEDDQPALHLQSGSAGPARVNGVARDADRPHALLRFPAARPRQRSPDSRRASSCTRCPGRSTTRRRASSCSRARTASCSWPTASAGSWTRTSRACRTCTRTSRSRASTRATCRS